MNLLAIPFLYISPSRFCCNSMNADDNCHDQFLSQQMHLMVMPNQTTILFFFFFFCSARCYFGTLQHFLRPTASFASHNHYFDVTRRAVMFLVWGESFQRTGPIFMFYALLVSSRGVTSFTVADSGNSF